MLKTLALKLRTALAGSAVFDAEEISLERADDGTPSLAVPFRDHGAAIVVSPEPDRRDLYAVIMIQLGIMKTVATGVAADAIYTAISNAIIPPMI